LTPFSIPHFIRAIPASVKQIAVLDRCKEPTSSAEPLFMDVVNALNELQENQHAHVIGGRYGLSSKEFTPAMALSVFHELQSAHPKTHFTVGIEDDVTHLSLSYDKKFPALSRVNIPNWS